MNRLRAIFFCGDKSRYGFAHLEPFLKTRFEIIGIVLAPEARWKLFYETLNGRNYYHTLSVSARLKTFVRSTPIFRHKFLNPINRVEKLAQVYQTPLYKIFDVNETSFINQLAEMKPDFIFSAAYPQIFSADLLQTAEKMAVNFHPSILPKYRGAHPHFWAIAKGEAFGGISAHVMTPQLDQGDLIAQISFPIGDYNYNQLYTKIETETPALIKSVDNLLHNPPYKLIPQDNTLATFFTNDREIHHRIFWHLHSTEQIKNLVRTQTAFCFFRQKRLRIMEAKLVSKNRNLTNQVLVEDGTIVDLLEDSVVVHVQDGCIHLRQFIHHRKQLSATQWIASQRPRIGEKFD